MVKTEIEVGVTPHLDAVVVRPGDRLVIRVSRDMNPEEVRSLVSELVGHLPGVMAVLVICDQILVYRDGGPDD